MSLQAQPDAIVIVEHDPRWAATFEAESRRIRAAIGEWLIDLQHVGSTAVPGLAAKPIVDIMPGLRSLDDSPEVIAGMESLGYEYVQQYEHQLPERRYFVYPPGRESWRQRLFHVHAVETTSTFWERHLAFRDFLRADADACRQYAALKRRLAAECGEDREAYTNGKTNFIRAIEEKAAAARRPSLLPAERGTTDQR